MAALRARKTRKAAPCGRHGSPPTEPRRRRDGRAPETDLAALEDAAAGRSAHEPWLFYPRDGRWRWWSFRRGWAEVERWRAVLERGEGPAAGAAPPPESSPEALCFHLAASTGVVDDVGATDALAAFDQLLARDAPAREIVVVTPPAGAPLADATAAKVAGPLPTARLSRLWLTWCCANLAVLALEPSRRALVGSVLWCRPTTTLVDADQERLLAAAVVERSRGRNRRAAALLDRLRVLFVVEDGRDGAPDAADASDAPAARWRAWGVERRAVGQGAAVDAPQPGR